MLKNISKFIDKQYWKIIAFIGFIQIWLISNITIYQRGFSIHDDILMLDYAENLSSGNWLGTYDNKTLLKRISYPIFMAICNKLNIPYTFALGVLWTGACIVFIVAISKIISSKKVLLFSYIFILFNPVMYSFKWSQSMYRNAIIPAAVLLTIATLVGVYTRRNDSKKLIIWSIASAVTFAFFYNIREDSIWLVPFYICALAITIGKIIIENPQNKQMMWKIVKVCCSVVLVLVINFSICFTNYVHYGVFTSNELYDTNFRTMISIMNRLDENPELTLEKGITISHKTMKKLYDICPTIGQIKEYIEKDVFESFWQTIGDNVNDGEVYGGYIFWAMRDAIQDAGFYSNGQQANDFYGRICDELNSAIEKGKIKVKEKSGITIFGTRLFGDNSNDIRKAFFDNIKTMISYKNIEYCTTASVGNVDNLRRTEILTNNTLIYPDKITNTVSGWIVPKNPNDEIDVYVCDENSKVVEKLRLQQSDDVKEYYDSLGVENQKSEYAYFNYTEEQTNISQLIFFINDNEVGRWRIGENINQLVENEYYSFFIEKFETNIKTDETLATAKYDNIYNFIISIYKKTGMVLCFFALLGMVVMFVKTINNLYKHKKVDNGKTYITLGIFASYLLLQYGVATKYYQEVLAYKGWGYLSATCVLQGIFIIITLGVVVSARLNETNEN